MELVKCLSESDCVKVNPTLSWSLVLSQLASIHWNVLLPLSQLDDDFFLQIVIIGGEKIF